MLFNITIINDKVNENAEQIDIIHDDVADVRQEIKEMKETFTAQMTQMQKSFNKTLAEKDEEIRRLKEEKENKQKEFPFKVGVSE